MRITGIPELPSDIWDIVRPRIEAILNRPIDTTRIASPPIGWKGTVDEWASEVDREYFAAHKAADYYIRSPLRGELHSDTKPDEGCEEQPCGGHAVFVGQIEPGYRFRLMICMARPSVKPFSFEAAQAFGIRPKG